MKKQNKISLKVYESVNQLKENKMLVAVVLFVLFNVNKVHNLVYITVD